MTGDNYLSINQATMVQAMQHWFNSQFTAPPIVKRVLYKSNGYSDIFTIQFTDEKPQP